METYKLELTAPNVTGECRSADCDEHYVVRSDGTWVRAFHNERDAREFVEAEPSLQEVKSLRALIREGETLNVAGAITAGGPEAGPNTPDGWGITWV